MLWASFCHCYSGRLPGVSSSNAHVHEVSHTMGIVLKFGCPVGALLPTLEGSLLAPIWAVYSQG